MKYWAKLFTIVLALAFITPTSHAAIKSGSSCTKAGVKKVSAGKSYTCVKSGKKLIWSKGISAPIAKPAPSASPSATTTSTPSASAPATPAPIVVKLNFENLIENNSKISYTAWKKTSETIMSSVSKTGTLTVYSGPNTPVLFENIPYAIGLVSKMFPSKGEPKENLWIRYNAIDMSWAEKQAKEKLTSSDYNHIARNQGGDLTGTNCDTRGSNCRGSFQQTGPSGIALVMQGVENYLPNDLANRARMTTGMLEAHEYFHAVQRIPILNTGAQVWPHAWWREGGAEWVQNAAINYNNYEYYKSFITSDCSQICLNLSEAEIAEFLRTAKENTLPSKFDQWLNYSLGSHVVEILVAIRGADVLVDMYAEMGKGKTFDSAFETFFETPWKDAIPIIAESIYLNLRS